MKYRLIILITFIFFFNSLNAQEKKLNKIIEDFKMSSNDSIYLNKYSLTPYHIFTIENPYLLGFEQKMDSILFNANYNTVVGPFYFDTIITIYKIIDIDSLIKMRVGNIWLNTKKTSEDSIKKLSQYILNRAFNGEDFDELCKKYSDDNNSHQQCDLGWFTLGMMVSEFENAVLIHKKGEIFIAKTKYGLHVVKVLENPIKDRYKVKYIKIVIKK